MLLLIWPSCWPLTRRRGSQAIPSEWTVAIPCCRAEWVAEYRALATKVEQQVQRRNRLKDEIDDMQKQYGQEQEHLADARNLLSDSLDQMELDRVERERLQAERESLKEQLAKAREASREGSDVLMRNELH